MTDQLEAPAAVARQGKPRASDPVKVLAPIQTQEKNQAGRLDVYRAVEAAGPGIDRQFTQQQSA